jgi:excisionase family DNA binding protein
MEQVLLTQLSVKELQEHLSETVKEVLTAMRQQEVRTGPDELFTRKEAAKYLRLSLVTLNEYTQRGLVPAYRLGARVLYRRSEVDKCLTMITAVKHRRA